MNIRDVKGLKRFARERLEQTPVQRKLVLIYAGSLVGMSVLVALIQYLLDLQINQTSGLGGMGTRGILAAVQSVLPMIESVISMCLGLGFLSAMLRIARGQYVSVNSLRLGFDRFWVLLRKSILEGLMCFGVAMASMYAAMAVFMVTPLSRKAVELLLPVVQSGDPYAFLNDAALYGQLMWALRPFFVVFLLAFTVAVTPLLFRYRMADYILIDKPGIGAMAALRESRMMMRHNCMKLLRVDLGLWWYYAAVAVVTVIGYGDQLLPMLGVKLPFSGDGNYYLFFAIYQVLQLGLCVGLLGWTETTYALAYDAIRPKEKRDNGVVLGNIFQM